MVIPGATVVSILLPVHNGERFLADCLDSMLAQSFRDFELLALDDGSSDGSLALLKRYQRRDHRIRVFSRENRGLVATLNELIDLARGEWLARMDCDDVALPQRLERQLKWCEETGAEICGSWARYFGTSDRRIVKHPQSDQGIKTALLFGCPIVHPTVLIKRSVAMRLGYRRDWEKAEDYDLWERAARAGCKMANVPEVLLRYRKHPGQVSVDHGERQGELTRKIQLRWADHLLPELGMDPAAFAEVVEIRSSSSPKPDLDLVEGALRQLLERLGGESREVLLDHATRLYFRVAGSCPDAAESWGRLNDAFGNGSQAATGIKLRLLRMLRLGPESRMFHNLKKIQFYLQGSG